MKPTVFTNSASKEPIKDKRHDLLIKINSFQDIESLSNTDLKTLDDIFRWAPNGVYKMLGWLYDIRPYLKRFVIIFHAQPDESTPHLKEGLIIEKYSTSIGRIRKGWHDRTISEVYEIPNLKAKK